VFETASKMKVERLKVPLVRSLLSHTGTCGAIFFSSKSKSRISADPYALSALSRWGFKPKQVSARSSMVLAAPTSARRLARVASTSMMIEALRSIR
jgi:hypothetical protein